MPIQLGQLNDSYLVVLKRPPLIIPGILHLNRPPGDFKGMNSR
jgi:hypothetical protein